MAVDKKQTESLALIIIHEILDDMNRPQAAKILRNVEPNLLMS